MSGNELSGKCICGAVSFKATPQVSHVVGACHCDMCRKWASGPYLAVHCGDTVTFDGEENISIYRSSEWAERGFCNTCGSNLFWRLASGGAYGVSAGLFDDQDHWALSNEVFIDEKPDWYTFSNDTSKMTGAEVFAMFSGDNAPENAGD